MSLYDRVVLTERRNFAAIMRKGGALVRETGGRKSVAGRAKRKAAFNVKARADHELKRKAKRPVNLHRRGHEKSGTVKGKLSRSLRRQTQSRQSRGNPQHGAPGRGEGASRLRAKLASRRAGKPGYKMVFGKWVKAG